MSARGLLVGLARQAWNAKMSIDDFKKTLPDNLSESEFLEAASSVLDCVTQDYNERLMDYLFAITEHYHLNGMQCHRIDVNDMKQRIGVVSLARRYGSKTFASAQIGNAEDALSALKVLHVCLLHDDVDAMKLAIEQMCKSHNFLILVASGALYQREYFAEVQKQYFAVRPFPSAPVCKTTNVEILSGIMEEDCLVFASQIIESHQEMLIGLMLNVFITAKVSPTGFHYSCFSGFADKILLAFVQEFIDHPSLPLAFTLRSRLSEVPKAALSEFLKHQDLKSMPCFDSEEETFEYFYGREGDGDVKSKSFEELLAHPSILGDITGFLKRHLANVNEAVLVCKSLNHMDNGVLDLVCLLQEDDLRSVLNRLLNVLGQISDDASFQPVLFTVLGIIWWKWKEGPTKYRKMIEDMIKSLNYDMVSLICAFIGKDASEYQEGVFFVPVPKQQLRPKPPMILPIPIINGVKESSVNVSRSSSSVFHDIYAKPLEKCIEFVNHLKEGTTSFDSIIDTVRSCPFLIPFVFAWGISHPDIRYLGIKFSDDQLLDSLFKSMAVACSQKVDKWKHLLEDINYDLMIRFGPRSVEEIDSLIINDIRQIAAGLFERRVDLRNLTAAWRVWASMFGNDFLKMLLRNAYVIVRSEQMFGMFQQLLYAGMALPFIVISDSNPDFCDFCAFLKDLGANPERIDYDGMAIFFSVLSVCPGPKSMTKSDELAQFGEIVMALAMEQPNSPIAQFVLELTKISLHSTILSRSMHHKVTKFFLELGDWRFMINYYLLEAAKLKSSNAPHEDYA